MQAEDVSLERGFPSKVTLSAREFLLHARSPDAIATEVEGGEAWQILTLRQRLHAAIPESVVR